MKFFVFSFALIATTLSANTFAASLKQCNGKELEVTSAYQNCVNSNFRVLKNEFLIPVYPCSLQDNAELDMTYQGCINNNFSVVGMFLDNKGLDLNFCTYNQEDTFLSYYECVNNNFEQISEVLF